MMGSLAACVSKKSPDKMEVATELVAEKTVVEGQLINDVLKDPEKLRAAINAIRGAEAEKDTGTIGELVAKAWKENEGDEGLTALRGIGGMIGVALLDAAGRTIDERGRFNPHIPINVALTGKIVTFPYDDKYRKGSLEVKTRIVISLGGVPVDTSDWHWWIDVVDQGFTSIPKDVGHPNYFGPPNTIAFSPAMKADVDTRGFNWKLFARGSDIKVTKLTRNGAQVLPGSPWGFLLISQPEDCIDFLSQTRPVTGDLKVNHFGNYCLGRCRKPMIVNTGF
jgi:hypothetical protein